MTITKKCPLCDESVKMHNNGKMRCHLDPMGETCSGSMLTLENAGELAADRVDRSDIGFDDERSNRL